MQKVVQESRHNSTKALNSILKHICLWYAMFFDFFVCFEYIGIIMKYYEVWLLWLIWCLMVFQAMTSRRSTPWISADELSNSWRRQLAPQDIFLQKHPQNFLKTRVKSVTSIQKKLENLCWTLSSALQNLFLLGKGWGPIARAHGRIQQHTRGAEENMWRGPWCRDKCCDPSWMGRMPTLSFKFRGIVSQSFTCKFSSYDSYLNQKPWRNSPFESCK